MEYLMYVILAPNHNQKQQTKINKQNDPEEPLHVYISADTKEKVQVGVKKINDLIRESTDKYDEG